MVICFSTVCERGIDWGRGPIGWRRHQKTGEWGQRSGVEFE